MKKKDNKRSFFGLDASNKAKIIKKSAELATKEQLDLINKYGGIKILKKYSEYGSCNR